MPIDTRDRDVFKIFHKVKHNFLSLLQLALIRYLYLIEKIKVHIESERRRCINIINTDVRINPLEMSRQCVSRLSV